ncbi:MAG: PAS domain-containing protein, partial [Lachnospiraceae bacterium]|nr:PAS domain-containing protein [Lachnospiraceae bacterium]
MIMDNSLFNKIINTVSDCVFWKDKDRRFVGVNQAFLDFYGFDSVDVLLGKTDEDMGW